MTPPPSTFTAADWPPEGWTDDVRPALDRARRDGRSCALVTLCAVEGPSPRPVGTQMLIGEETVGHLSGGCIEGDLALHAAACLVDDAPRRLVYGRGSPWLDIRLACGGRLEVLVEPVRPDDPAIAAVLEAWTARRPVSLVSDGRRRRVFAADEAPAAPEDGYVRAYAPTTRLVVVGRDPTALAMCALSLQIGFETLLVSPDGPAAPPPLDGLLYDRAPPNAALASIGLDRWTAVAVATHDTAWDEEALAAALPSPAVYVGALGARSRLTRQTERLLTLGTPAPALARLHAPIGQPGYGKASWAVAVSAIAEILQVVTGAEAAAGVRG